MTWIVALIICLIAISGVPLFLVMGVTALIAFTLLDISTSTISIEIYRLASTSALTTIPLFTLAGYFLAESNAPNRIVNFADKALGWLPGGVAICAISVCAFFTAFTGASGVTIIALGGILYPILKRTGLSEMKTIGLITSSGSLGLLFVPSLPLILYGVVAQVDINKLFLAGIIPGIMLIGILSLWAIKNSNRESLKLGSFSWREIWISFKAAFFELLLPVLLIVGIYGGIVTPSEAAAFTAFYVVIVEVVIYRDVKVNAIPRIIIDSMSLVGSILLILCCALGVTNFIIDEEIPNLIFEYIKTVIDSKIGFLLFLNLFLLLVGSLMDIFSAIIVVVPLIVPIATSFGVDPVHLAIIFLTNLEIGYLTPPVGINLFISSMRFEKSLVDIYKSALPFLLILIVALLIITYVPILSLGLVNLWY